MQHGHRTKTITLTFDSFETVAVGQIAKLVKHTYPLSDDTDSKPIEWMQLPFRGVCFVFPLKDMTPWDDWWLESAIIAGEESLVIPIPLMHLAGRIISFPTSPVGTKIELGVRNAGKEARRVRIGLRGQQLL